MRQSFLPADLAFPAQGRQAGVHGKHGIGGGGVNHAVNLGNLVFADHIPDGRRHSHHLEGGGPGKAVCRWEKLLGYHGLESGGQLYGDLTLLAGRKDVDDAVDSAGRAGRVKRRKNQVSGFGRCHGDGNGLEITHFPQKDDVRALAQRGPQGYHIAVCVGADFALAYDASFVPVKEFQRVLHRDDMLFLSLVDGIDDAGQRRGFAASCRAGDQHKAPGQPAKPNDLIRDSKRPGIRKLKRDNTDHRGHGAALQIGADTETGEPGYGKGKIVVALLNQAGNVPAVGECVDFPEHPFRVGGHQAFLPQGFDTAALFKGKLAAGYDKEVGSSCFNSLCQKIQSVHLSFLHNHA